MKKGTKITIGAMAVVAILAIGVLFLAARGFSAKPDSGQHVDHVDWLPASASDISFYRNGDPLFPMYCFECTMPYESLLRFAEEKGWALSERSPVQIFGRGLLHLPKVKIEGSAFDEAYVSALEYTTHQGNGGGIQVVYHRPSSRLFVYYSAN